MFGTFARRERFFVWFKADPPGAGRAAAGRRGRPLRSCRSANVTNF